METTDLDLRKFALAEARTLRGADSPAEAVIAAARDIYTFLSTPVQEARPRLAEEDETTLPESSPVGQPHIRPHYLPPLSVLQKAVLNKAIELFREKGKITGTEIGEGLNWPNPVSANPFLQKLQKAGYIRRDGWSVIPLYKPDGTKLEAIIQKLPDGVAMGYKPMTAPLGTVGRIG